MATCNDWQKLNKREQELLIGELVHAISHDGLSLLTARNLIHRAKHKGVFDGVEILPERREPEPVINY